MGLRRVATAPGTGSASTCERPNPRYRRPWQRRTSPPQVMGRQHGSGEVCRSLTNLLTALALVQFRALSDVSRGPSPTLWPMPRCSSPSRRDFGFRPRRCTCGDRDASQTAAAQGGGEGAVLGEWQGPIPLLAALWQGREVGRRVAEAGEGQWLVMFQRFQVTAQSVWGVCTSVRSDNQPEIKVVWP